ncbi:MAG TPA: hypothetical protein VGF92_16505 [Stellaceae bacterium]
MLTLASRPALAAGQCNASNAISGNQSHPLPNGTNCGLTPATWVSLAGTNQLWARTGFSPSTTFSVNGSSGFDSSWNIGTVSLLSALQGGLSIKVQTSGGNGNGNGNSGGPGSSSGGNGNGNGNSNGGGSTTLNAAEFGEQVAAALLNAAAFAPNNYPYTLSEVEQMAMSIFGAKPSSAAVAQSELDSLASKFAAININT